MRIRIHKGLLKFIKNGAFAYFGELTRGARDIIITETDHLMVFIRSLRLLYWLLRYLYINYLKMKIIKIQALIYYILLLFLHFSGKTFDITKDFVFQVHIYFSGSFAFYFLVLYV